MNTDELIEHVTNDMIAAIENGADTWQMPWHTIATNAQPRRVSLSSQIRQCGQARTARGSGRHRVSP